MSVLSELSQRLKTDLADTARASIDPTFSRQLTEANFRDKAFQQERKAALEDQARIRQQQVADQQRSEQARIQTWAFEQAYDEGIKTGNWTPVANLLEQPGLQDVIREQATRTLDMRLPQGQEGVLRAAQIDKTLADMSNNEIRIELERRRLNNEDIRMINERIDLQWQRDYDKAKDMLNEQTEVTNINQLVRHLEGSKGVFTDEEIENTAEAMRNAVDTKTAKTIYDRAWDFANARHIQEGKNARSKEQANANRPLSRQITAADVAVAETVIAPLMTKNLAGNEKDKDFFDIKPGFWEDVFFVSDEDIDRRKINRRDLSRVTAIVANDLARDFREGASSGELESAYELALLFGLDTIDGEKTFNTAPVLRIKEKIERAKVIEPRITLQDVVGSYKKSTGEGKDIDKILLGLVDAWKKR